MLQHLHDSNANVASASHWRKSLNVNDVVRDDMQHVPLRTHSGSQAPADGVHMVARNVERAFNVSLDASMMSRTTNLMLNPSLAFRAVDFGRSDDHMGLAYHDTEYRALGGCQASVRDRPGMMPYTPQRVIPALPKTITMSYGSQALVVSHHAVTSHGNDQHSDIDRQHRVLYDGDRVCMRSPIIVQTAVEHQYGCESQRRVMSYVNPAPVATCHIVPTGVITVGEIRRGSQSYAVHPHVIQSLISSAESARCGSPASAILGRHAAPPIASRICVKTAVADIESGSWRPTPEEVSFVTDP
jgi:hypothetical protein